MTFQRILKCDLFDEDGLWVLNSDIGVEGTGVTVGAAAEDLETNLVEQYRRLVGRPDEELTGDARRLRNDLTALIADVEPR